MRCLVADDMMLADRAHAAGIIRHYLSLNVLKGKFVTPGHKMLDALEETKELVPYT